MTRTHDGAIEGERIRAMERLLGAIRTRPRPLPLADLAEAIADQGRSEWPSYPGSIEDERRLRIRLHHVDLPKLDEAGAIEYDPALRVVF